MQNVKKELVTSILLCYLGSYDLGPKYCPLGNMKQFCKKCHLLCPQQTLGVYHFSNCQYLPTPPNQYIKSLISKSYKKGNMAIVTFIQANILSIQIVFLPIPEQICHEIWNLSLFGWLVAWGYSRQCRQRPWCIHRDSLRYQRSRCTPQGSSSHTAATGSTLCLKTQE